MTTPNSQHRRKLARCSPRRARSVAVRPRPRPPSAPSSRQRARAIWNRPCASPRDVHVSTRLPPHPTCGRCAQPPSSTSKSASSRKSAGSPSPRWSATRSPSTSRPRTPHRLPAHSRSPTPHPTCL
ncbi:hypothetical protein ACFPRL_35650 [Pseudoclavibacter helvolus]